jgi:predicted ribosome quality control (RQC) complex YloA/Tae2 family protein
VDGFGSPLTIICANADGDPPTDGDLKLAASICAKYSDAKGLPVVEVSVTKNSLKYIIKANPANSIVLDEYRIQPNK